MSTKPQAAIVINGQAIPWAFIQRVRTQHCGGDWPRTIDVFYKARNATGTNGIVRYIQKGLVENDRGVRYSLIPSPEFEEPRRRTLIMQWWEGLYKTAPTRKEPTRARDTLKSMLLEMAGAL